MDRIVDNRSRPEDALRAAIEGGELLPGQRLVEADLSRQLGVGRAAVRTALARLEHEGLLSHEANRGARVRLVPLDEAVEIVEVRGALEGLVVRRAAERADAEDVRRLRGVLDEMRRLLELGDLLAASDRNADLHRLLLELGGHETANRLIGTLRSQLVRFEYRTILAPGRAQCSLAEHTAIVDAVADGDGERAEAAMRAHLRNVARALAAVER
ncbi:MAG: GntR family transcriptional regulator [Solirubrobacteraceae bacterium]